MENKKETILFVDDELNILEITRDFFTHKGYNVITADNGTKALEILGKNTIDCCFTDITMPQMDGLELAEYIREKDNTIPVIVMTGYPSLNNTIRTLKNGVVDFLIKPVNLNQMELCVRRVLRERKLFVENIILKEEIEGKERLEKLNQELLYKIEELDTLNKIMTDVSAIGTNFDVYNRVVDMTIGFTYADESKFYVINEVAKQPFVKTLEARDLYTEQHSSRVTEIAVLIGKEIGCSEEEIDILNIAGPLHDIGKIGIRDDILLKPGKLTNEEFEKIKEHPAIGARIIGQLGMWDEHRQIIRHHHERFDGSGYPDGLKEDEIPLLARVVAVVDAYDVMASDRAYRKMMPPEKILKIIRECTGTQFDPRLANVFLKLHEEGKI